MGAQQTKEGTMLTIITTALTQHAAMDDGSPAMRHTAEQQGNACQ